MTDVRFMPGLNLIRFRWAESCLDLIQTHIGREQLEIQNRAVIIRVVIPFQNRISIQHMGVCSDIIPNLAQLSWEIFLINDT